MLSQIFAMIISVPAKKLYISINLPVEKAENSLLSQFSMPDIWNKILDWFPHKYHEMKFSLQMDQSAIVRRGKIQNQKRVEGWLNLYQLPIKMLRMINQVVALRMTVVRSRGQGCLCPINYMSFSRDFRVAGLWLEFYAIIEYVTVYTHITASYLFEYSISAAVCNISICTVVRFS